MLLTADIHLTDNPQDEYRWNIFSELARYTKIGEEIFILGDLTDRADRHSSVLVNRMVSSLCKLAAYNPVTIISGNHDQGLKPPVYFSFLETIPGVFFYTKPSFRTGLALLPYSANPYIDWADINFHEFKAAFIHQTVKGATLKPGRIAESDNLPPFPKSLKVYAGDLHIPHNVGNVIYVGSPHHIKFGDTYDCRLLRLDDDFNVSEVIKLNPLQKRMISVSSLDELKDIETVEGDQAKVNFTFPSGKMDTWPVEQQAIAAWAKERGVTLTSIKAIVEVAPTIVELGEGEDPETVLEAFCRKEGVDQELLDYGLNFIRNRS